jgi:hypothetical protein
MRYHTRQRIRQATTLAWQRSVHRLTPQARRLSAFLAADVDWDRIGAQPGNRRALVAFCLERKRDRVRFMTDSDDVRWYANSDPFGTHAAALNRADAARAHRIEIANLGVIGLGSRVEWERDPVTGTRFPTHLFSVRPQSGVDERFRAELNYHRHFSSLAIAWAISADERYRRELVDQWRSWLDWCPPVDDTFLNDGLETTIRVLVWTHCLFLLGPNGIAEDFCLELLARLNAYGHLIERNYKHVQRGNNHQIAEAVGLLLIGLLYPELKRSQRWLEAGLRFLQEQVESQVTRGGVHAEQSAAYHLFVLECLQLALLMCRRNDISMPAAFSVKVEEATEYLMYLMKPDGTLPQLGDGCGLRVLSPTGATGLRPRTALAVGAFLFNRADMAAVGGEPDEDIFWFVGGDGICWLRQHASIEAKPVARTKILPEGGHAIVRSGWAPDSHYVCLGFRPQGAGEQPGHAHDDVLSFEFHALGQRFVVDAGTYTYLRNHPLRRYFTGARGHNAIIVDADQSSRLNAGPLSWRNAAGELVDAGSSNDLDWVTARHTGYVDGKQDVVVERSLLTIKDEYILVLDRVSGSGLHAIESLLHLAPGLQISVAADGVYCHGAQADLQVVHVASAATGWSVHRGADGIQPGWYAEHYGALVDAYVLRGEARASLPYWQLTGLFPRRGRGHHDVRLTRMENSAGTATVAVEGWRRDGRDMLSVRWDREPRMVLVRERGTRSHAHVYRRTGTGFHGKIAELVSPDGVAAPPGDVDKALAAVDALP